MKPVPLHLAILLILLLVAVPGSLEGRVLNSIPGALEQAFPVSARAEKQRIFLTAVQEEKFKKISGKEVKLTSRIITRFIITRKSKIEGYAYLDTHRVRSGRETLMIILTPAGAVKRLFLLSFRGDSGYEPKESWLQTFSGISRIEKLNLKHGIDAISGATITSEAVIRSIQRTLILHKIISRQNH